MITCDICDSERIEEKRWVNVNTLELSDLVNGSELLYCLDCGEQVPTSGKFPGVHKVTVKVGRRKLKIDE